MPTLDQPGLTTVQLVLQNYREGFEERLICRLCLQHASLQRIADARQVELFERTLDFGH
jgi:hypothetical protein